jgi:hypothetical protein
MYHLDLPTIIQLLKGFRRSGMLQTELPKGIVNSRETCWIQFNFVQGEITDSHIITKSGEVTITNAKVLHQVKELGPREWNFTASTKIPDNSSLSTTTPRPPRPAPLTLVPCRKAKIEQYSLNTLTRQQRRVLALVDSKRNVGQIATLLFSSSNIQSGAQEVLTLLQELEVLGIIAFR